MPTEIMYVVEPIMPIGITFSQLMQYYEGICQQ